MTRRRLAALTALAFGAATAVFAVAVAIANFPNAITVLAWLVAGAALGWSGLRCRGAARLAGLGGMVLGLAGAVVLVIVQRSVLGNAIVVAGVLVTLGAAAR